ncbi:MAG: hypothetical protein JWP81_426 [Ferruginibacter sp.]|nr:hypothetical protein [Ferruginibacter sp.]
MNKSAIALFITLVLTIHFANGQANNGIKDRQFWLEHLDKIARPVLTNLAGDALKKNMPVQLSKRIDNPTSRKNAAYLEAFARLLCGMAPWLNLEGGTQKEQALRNEYRQLALKSIANAVNPSSKDYMEWHAGGQPLVDASFMALGLLRCPWLWEHLDTSTKKQVIDAFLLTRKVKPGYSNWLLFSGMIEVFFCKYNYQWDELKVDLILHQFDKWYVGDGLYSDGEFFHWDYYNSYVIHPYLQQIMETFNEKGNTYKAMSDKLKRRSERYAEIQERLINTDGSFPATGRSLIYRGGAFHHLADMAWKKKLPSSLKPSQVRCALTAVIKKTMEQPTTFTNEGWLTIGLYGAQPDIADVYNTTGSLYLCSFILLPLGLPETDAFWSAPDEMWTAQKVWNGFDAPNDHASD